MDTKNCKVCGELISRPYGYSQAQWDRRSYCSPACQGKGRRLEKELPNPSGVCMCGCGNTTPLAAATNARDNTLRGEHVQYLNGHKRRANEKARGGRGKYGYGKFKTKSGYIYQTIASIPKEDVPLIANMVVRSRGDFAILEHRYVMAKLLGRPLTEKENVHHKNGRRDDNSPENLELWSKPQPNGRRVSDVCQHCHGTGLAYPQESDAE